MFDRIVSLVPVSLMGLILFLFEAGQMAPRDAFFIACAIVIVFTGARRRVSKSFPRKGA